VGRGGLTFEGVLEIDWWRGRAERGVKPTEIGVPSRVKRVSKRTLKLMWSSDTRGEKYVCPWMGQIVAWGEKIPLLPRCILVVTENCPIIGGENNRAQAAVK